MERTPQVIADGRAHFADHYAVCHGNDGSGKTEMGQGTWPKAPDMRHLPDLSEAEFAEVEALNPKPPAETRQQIEENDSSGVRIQRLVSRHNRTCIRGDSLSGVTVMARKWVLATMLTGLTVIPITAHEVTYEGTVAAVEPNRYSAADGILARLEVNVRDGKRPMVFDITQYTRLWRGNSPVTFGTARIQKDEPVTVTFSDEEADKGALEVRLPAQK